MALAMSRITGENDANGFAAILKHIHCAGRIRKTMSLITSLHMNLQSISIYTICVLEERFSGVRQVRDQIGHFLHVWYLI
jgi:hypothetical protein